jgi:hypothetical protein
MAGWVGEGAVGVNDDGEDVFIDGGGVGEVAVAIEEFAEAGDEVVCDLALGFEFGFKDDVFSFAVADGGLRALRISFQLSRNSGTVNQCVNDTRADYLMALKRRYGGSQKMLEAKRCNTFANGCFWCLENRAWEIHAILSMILFF